MFLLISLFGPLWHCSLPRSCLTAYATTAHHSCSKHPAQIALLCTMSSLLLRSFTQLFPFELSVGIGTTLTRAGLNCNCIFHLNLSGQLPLSPRVSWQRRRPPVCFKHSCPRQVGEECRSVYRFARARLLRILQMCINRKEIILELEQYVC